MRTRATVSCRAAALPNAASIAGLILTTERMIARLAENAAISGQDTGIPPM